MFKSSKTLLCVCLLLCMGHFVQALDLIEVMDLTVPVESALANIHITCTNSEKFVECECFYGNETHRLTKVVVNSPQETNEAEFKQESRKMLSWVAEHLMPSTARESVRTDYAELWVSNSWGEVAFVKAGGNGLSVTVENIAITKRMNQPDRTSVSFPDEFMGFNLSSRVNATNLVKATASIFEGADRGKYEYYVWNIPSSCDRQSFFDNASCELSLKSKRVLAVQLTKCFKAEDRVKVVDECRKIMVGKHCADGMRDIVNPITGEVIGGVLVVDGSGMCASFQIEQKGSPSKLLLTVKFQLPKNAYGELLAEGTSRVALSSGSGGCCLYCGGNG